MTQVKERSTAAKAVHVCEQHGHGKMRPVLLQITQSCTRITWMIAVSNNSSQTASGLLGGSDALPMCRPWLFSRPRTSRVRFTSAEGCSDAFHRTCVSHGLCCSHASSSSEICCSWVSTCSKLGLRLGLRCQQAASSLLTPGGLRFGSMGRSPSAATAAASCALSRKKQQKGDATIGSSLCFWGVEMLR